MLGLLRHREKEERVASSISLVERLSALYASTEEKDDQRGVSSFSSTFAKRPTSLFALAEEKEWEATLSSSAKRSFALTLSMKEKNSAQQHTLFHVVHCKPSKQY